MSSERRLRSGLRAPAPALGLGLALAWLYAGETAATPSAGGETVEQALCRLIDDSAKVRGLPVAFLTRLIWRESSFRVGVVSSAGAQGVAQFMPGTARERGLTDPFDPEQAVPHAAHFLSDLRRQFGNLGLAAAAYNGGPGRVASWLAGTGGLPAETRTYVLAITGRPAEDWRPSGRAAETPEARKDGEPKREAETDAKPNAKADAKPDAGGSDAARSGKADETDKERPKDPVRDSMRAEGTTCLQVTAALRVPNRSDRFALPLDAGPAAPWGVQLAGNFSKQLALASFSRARTRYSGVIGEVRPMIIGTRLLNRGTRAFYRIRIPAQSRAAADGLCTRIRAVGGACLVLRT